MKRTIQTVVLAASAAGVFALLPGCQNRNHHDDTNRPVAATATFSTPYVAARDTEWVAVLNQANAERGRVPAGTRVYFDSSLGSSEWQQARVEGRGVVYVHPADFRADVR